MGRFNALFLAICRLEPQAATRLFIACKETLQEHGIGRAAQKAQAQIISLPPENKLVKRQTCQNNGEGCGVGVNNRVLAITAGKPIGVAARAAVKKIVARAACQNVIASLAIQAVVA